MISINGFSVGQKKWHELFENFSCNQLLLSADFILFPAFSGRPGAPPHATSKPDPWCRQPDRHRQALWSEWTTSAASSAPASACRARHQVARHRCRPAQGHPLQRASAPLPARPAWTATLPAPPSAAQPPAASLWAAWAEMRNLLFGASRPPLSLNFVLELKRTSVLSFIPCEGAITNAVLYHSFSLDAANRLLCGVTTWRLLTFHHFIRICRCYWNTHVLLWYSTKQRNSNSFCLV